MFLVNKMNISEQDGPHFLGSQQYNIEYLPVGHGGNVAEENQALKLMQIQ